MHISNHLILRQWNSRPSTSESLVSTSSEEGTAWRGDVSRFPKAFCSRCRQATMRRPDCRMTQVLGGNVLYCMELWKRSLSIYTKHCDIQVWNMYEICMKYVWHMYDICMTYVMYGICAVHPPAQAWTLCDFVTVCSGNDSFISAKASDGFAESAS